MSLVADLVVAVSAVGLVIYSLWMLKQLLANN
jgi:hypothetical protein